MTHLTEGNKATAPRTDISTSPEAQSSDNLFRVLAQRASERSPAELWTTAIGGSVNATFIWFQHPSLHWLGAGFTAVAAYGLWGLADHAISMRNATEEPGKSEVRFLRGLRDAVVPIGVLSAIVALGSFMAAALGGWNH